ncbi:MAG: PaaX family transcriptional regulator, partial [Nocardioides sp.]
MTEVQPRRLITTLFGLYAREDELSSAAARRGGWLSVAGLVRLMADLGVDAAAVRSSVSRLKKRGVVEAERRDGSAGYALSADAIEVLREGDTRIWSPSRASAADGWLVALFSVPETERDKRHLLRSTLAGLGFGSAAPGVWIAPATSADEALAALTRRGLAAYTEFFAGAYLGSDVAHRMGEWWDLPAIAAQYDEFLARFGPLRSAPGGTDRDAFAAYVPLLTVWRRLPYL